MYSSSLVKRPCPGMDMDYRMPCFEHPIPVACQNDRWTIANDMADEARTYREDYRAQAQSIREQAHVDAAKILADARKKAAELLMQTETQAKQIFESNFKLAQSKGYDDGLESGMLDAQQTVESAMTELSCLSRQLVQENERLLETHKDRLVDLAFQIARKVIGDSFQLKSDAFYAMFECVVKDIPPADKLVVTVSGKDYALHAFDAEKLKEIAGGFQQIELRTDDSGDTGMLRLETAIMVLDAGMNTQFGLMKKELSSVV